MRKEIKELIDNGSIFFISRDEKNIEIDTNDLIQCQETRERTVIYKRTTDSDGNVIFTTEKDYNEILNYIKTLNIIPAYGNYLGVFSKYLINKESLLNGNFPFKILNKALFADYFYDLVVLFDNNELELSIDKTSAYLDDAIRLFFEL